MNVQRDPDAILAAWLEEGPNELPEATRRAIAVASRTNRQTRRAIGVPWRSITMNPLTRLAAAAVVAAIAIGGAVYLFAPGNQVGGPSGPSAKPIQSSSTIPSPIVVDSPSGFDPPIRLTLIDGWTTYTDPNPEGIVDLRRGPIDTGIMSIARLTVRGPTPTSPMVPWPDDIHAWLAGRPEFRPSEPRETTVGGRPGIIIDVDVVVVPETDTGDWIKYGDVRPNGWNLKDADGERFRLVVVYTGARSGIVAMVGVSSADFDANAAAFDRLLATLEFR